MFHLLCEQVGGTIEDAFTTSLLQNNESIRLEVNATVSKAAEEATREKQADSAISRVTHCTLQSESFVEKNARRIVEDENVLNSFVTHAKCHVNKAMGDWQATTNLAKQSLNHRTM